MMNSRKQLSVSVIVPAYNEQAVIGEIISRIRKVNPDYEIIVVDDGSNDMTTEEAMREGAAVVVHPYNLGNGASVRTGCLKAKGDIIVMLDSDGQHPPEKIPDLIKHIGDYDMCVGARTAKSQTSRFRNVGNFILNHLGSWIAGTKIDDLTSGFRAIKRKPLFEYIHLFPKRYSYPTTITMAMMQGNYFIKYVPLDEIKRRDHGTSNIRPVHDFMRFVTIMLRVLVLFSPNRFFLPLSAGTLFVGSALGVYQLVQTSGIHSGSLMLIISSVIFFCFGLLADQIAEIRRSKNQTIELDRLSD